MFEQFASLALVILVFVFCFLVYKTHQLKRIVRSICIFVLCAILVFGLSSCTHKHAECDKCEEKYLGGYENGVEDVFFRMFNASTDFTTLFHGDVWDTEHFSLVLYDKLYGEDYVLNYDITLKNTTVNHCLKYENFFFNIYANYEGVDDGQYGEMILTRDNFIWHGIIDYVGSTDEYLEGNNVKSNCFLYNDLEYQSFLIIVATEGCLYSAAYYP